MPSSFVRRTFMRQLARVVTLLAVALAASTGTAWADLNFTDPLPLPKSTPDDKGKTEMQGGEPSLAFDPAGDGHFYAVAPGGNDKGVNFWGSSDFGSTWPILKTAGSI